MTVVLKADELEQLLDTDSEVEQLATGFIFTEGPIWNAEGEFLLFSDMPGDVRRRWSERDGVEEVMRPANKCNGMVYDADGNLLVCEHVTSSLVREHPRRHARDDRVALPRQGAAEPERRRRRARTGRSTSATRGSAACPVFGVEREHELDFQGVYRIPAGGGELELAVAEDEFELPNGLCFSPDESLLYINDTHHALIKVYDVAADGTLSNGRLFFDEIGNGVVEEGIPDGMKCDERGNIWVTGPGGVWIINARGEQLGVLEIPENVGNLGWGGSDWRTLFIPSSTSVYRIQTKVASARLPYHR